MNKKLYFSTNKCIYLISFSKSNFFFIHLIHYLITLFSSSFDMNNFSPAYYNESYPFSNHNTNTVASQNNRSIQLNVQQANKLLISLQKTYLRLNQINLNLINTSEKLSEAAERQRQASLITNPVRKWFSGDLSNDAQ